MKPQNQPSLAPRRATGAIRLIVVVLMMVAAVVAPMATTAPAAGAAPKAYIGLFKDNAVAVLDTGTNTVLTTIPIPTGPHGLVITPDGRWVYASSDGDSKVSVIDTQTDKVTATIEVGKTPHGLAITKDGRWVLSAVFGTGMVAFIDTTTNQVAGQAAVANPHNIAISPDGTMAYVASQAPNAAALAILDLGKKAVTGSVPLDKVPRALDMSPDGKQLFFTLAGSDSVQVLDTATNKITTQIAVGASPHHPRFTADGKEALVVAQGPGELDILDPAADSQTATVKVGKMPHWIALTPDGHTAYVTNEGSNDVSVVDLATNKVTATIPVGNAPRKIVIQPAPATTAQSGTPADMKVSIAGFAFAPASVTVAPGQRIVWTNNDSVVHTVTSTDGPWDSKDIAPGQSFSLTLDKAGTYTYHCGVHPFMQGTVTVKA
jgi:YVTN family beta-propeller protein